MKRIPLVIVLLTAGLVTGSQAQPPKIRKELSKLPPEVRKTIHQNLRGGKVESIDTDNEDGETSYDIEIIRDGVERGLTIGGDGQLIDEEVLLKELSAAVQQTIRTHLGTGTLDEIDKSEDGGEIAYEVELTRNNQSRSFTVDGDGTLMTEEVFLNELPSTVQQTIRKQVGTATLDDIQKSNEDGEISYDVEMTANGKSRNFAVGAKGELLEVEVSLPDLPPALQAAIQKAVNGAGIESIQKTFDDGEVSFDVDLAGDGPDRTLSFDADGNLQSDEQEISLSAAPAPVQAKINEMTAHGKLVGITKIVEDGDTSFDVEIKDGAADKIVTLDTAGKPVEDDK